MSMPKALPTLSSVALCLSALASSLRPAAAQGTCAWNDADFKRTILLNRPPEPTRLAILPDGRVMWTELRGTVKIWLPQSNTVEQVYSTPTYAGGDNGFHGIALDPAFATNGWVYMAYDPLNDSHPDGVGRWLSRFTLVGNRINASSEKKLLHVRIERNLGSGCCHQGGALAFDKAGDLLWTVGEQRDYQPGIASFNENNAFQNTLATVGNTNDLRGKLLRIKPLPIGENENPAAGVGSTYSIPAGNLVPPNLAKTRPEIYGMGFRNPFTMGYDPKNDWVFVGEVGMDFYVPDPEKGPAGHDEIHLVKKAGHYGYPFAVGNNQMLRHYDPVNNRTGPEFKPDSLYNNSKFNTGLIDLRPAGAPIPPIIYYTNRVAYSKDFPQMGDGRMAAFTGTIYRYDDSKPSTMRWPAFLDGRLLAWDQERDVVRLATLDAEGKVVKLDRILANVPFVGLIDAKWGVDGALYTIEYGHAFNTPNPEAKFSRIEYTGAPCGSVAVNPLPAREISRAPVRFAYDGGAAGLSVALPTGASGVDAYGITGRHLGHFRASRGGAARVTLPSASLKGEGLVLVRFRE
jgi:glucose/arabinose dehydrogenase